jgi:hypothetical protein
MKFIAALNAINSQVWAFLMLLTGVGAVYLFHKEGLDIGIAAGVMGAAVNMFQSIAKAQSPTPGIAESTTTVTSTIPPPSPTPPPVTPAPAPETSHEPQP